LIETDKLGVEETEEGPEILEGHNQPEKREIGEHESKRNRRNEHDVEGPRIRQF